MLCNHNEIGDFILNKQVLFSKVSEAIKENPNPFPLVAINGKMGAGKDTVAPPLSQRLNGSIGRHIFLSEPLKIEVSSFVDSVQNGGGVRGLAKDFNVPLLQAEEFFVLVTKNNITDIKVKTPPVRKLLQLWGTELRRSQDDDYWIKKAFKNILDGLLEGDHIYLTDVRFLNEASSVKEVEGKIVRLEISEEEQARRILLRDGTPISTEAKNHPSETDLDGCHHLFDSMVDVDEYVDNIDGIVDRISKDLRGGR